MVNCYWVNIKGMIVKCHFDCSNRNRCCYEYRMKQVKKVKYLNDLYVDNDFTIIDEFLTFCKQGMNI
jgi:hypothetical protein